MKRIPWNKGKKGLQKAWNKGLKGVMPTPWNKGKICSIEIRKKISESCKGRIAWNKGVTGYKINVESRKGMKLSEEHKKNIGKSQIGIKKKKGWKLSEETRKRMSLSRRGDKHPNWRGGTSNEPYGYDFTNRLTKIIRKRDNFTCQECKHTEKELGYSLHIHHIDYNKKNNNQDNLISLCKSCHAQTNFKRENWIDYYKEKVEASSNA